MIVLRVEPEKGTAEGIYNRPTVSLSDREKQDGLVPPFDRQSAHWCDRPGRCTEEENRKDVLNRPTVSLLNGEKQGGLSPPLLRFRTEIQESWFPSDCLPASAEAFPGCR